MAMDEEEDLKVTSPFEKVENSLEVQKRESVDIFADSDAKRRLFRVGKSMTWTETGELVESLVEVNDADLLTSEFRDSEENQEGLGAKRSEGSYLATHPGKDSWNPDLPLRGSDMQPILEEQEQRVLDEHDDSFCPDVYPVLAERDFAWNPDNPALLFKSSNHGEDQEPEDDLIEMWQADF